MAGAWQSNDRWGTDLAQIFLQARAQRSAEREQSQRMKMQELAMQRERDEMERTALEPEAIAAYQQRGDGQMLQVVNPKLLQELEKDRAAQQRLATEAQAKAAQTHAAAEQAKREKTARVQQYAARMLQQNPEAAQQVLGNVKQMADRGEIYAFELPEAAPTPDVARRVQVDAEAASAAAGLKQEEIPLDDIAKRVIYKRKLRPGMPGFPEAYAAEEREIQRQELAARKAGATSVNVGTGQSGIESGTKAQFEKDIVTSNDLLKRIDRVEGAIDAELVGFAGKKNEKAGAFVDYFGAPAEAVVEFMGIDSAQAVGVMERRQALKSQVRDLGDLVIRVRSGANAPPAEVEKLEQIMGSIDSMGEKQLRAALQTFRTSLQGQRDAKADAIAHGINVIDPKKRQKDSGAKKTEHPSGVPEADRAQIIESYKRKLGRAPTDDELAQTYQSAHKARGGK